MMKILSGIYSKDEGTIKIDGIPRKVQISADTTIESGKLIVSLQNPPPPLGMHELANTKIDKPKNTRITAPI